MPTYEFRCRECGATYDVNRPMIAANDPAPCPDGHHDTVKLLTMAGLSGRSGAGAPPAGGGCCGGGCCG